MNQKPNQNQNNLSHQILMQKQYIMVDVVDETTGETKSYPRFVMRGVRRDGRPVYYHGNKNFDKMRELGYKVTTVINALNLQAKMMVNYASDLKIFDNAAPKEKQLIFHWTEGIGQLLKERWEEYTTYKRI